MDEMSLDEIARLPLPDAYRLLLTLAEEDGSVLTPKNRSIVRFGIDFHFDLQHYMNGFYKVEEKNGVVYIAGMALKLTTFFTEVEKRDALVRRLLIKGMVGKEVFGTRAP